MTDVDQRDSTGSYREALERLRSAQKNTKGAPAYSRFVNRRAGRYLAAGAHLLGMTPNAVTAISAAFSFAAIAVLAVFGPSLLVGMAVTLGLVIGYALDSADGQLARLRGGGSTSGEWLDHMVDATKISSLHLAVLISTYRFFDLPSDAWLLVPVGFTVVGAVSFFGMTLNDQLRRNKSSEKVITRADTSSPLRALLVLPTDYGLLCFVFLLLGWPSVFFVVYGTLFFCCALFLVLAAVKWYRDMRAIDLAPSVQAR
ncbi:CDP-alcohol phosphatidyltransferase family protein [Nakamurella sp. GG22]